MKKFVFGLFVFFTMLSCSEPTKKGAPSVAEGDVLAFDSLKVEKVFYASGDSTKPFLELKLHFTYPAAYTSDSALIRIQRLFVEAFAGKELAGRSPIGAFEALERKIVDETLDLFSKEENLKEIPDSYNRMVETTVFNSYGTVLTLQTEEYTYNIGAVHGSYDIRYRNIDLKENKLITEDDLFKAGTEDKLAALIREALQKEYGDELNNMLFEPDNDVRPNGNFYINKDKIVYVYNQYEIAPYAVGVVEAPIPLEKAKELMRLEIE